MQRQQTTNLKDSFDELKRRKVIRSLLGYAVFAWVVLQIVDFSFEPLRLPDWLATVVVIAIIVGFPIVAILSWAFDWTEQGIKRAEASTGLRSWQVGLVLLIMLLPVLGLCLFFYQTYGGFIESELSGTESTAATELSGAAGQADSLIPPARQSIAILPLADFDASELTGQMGSGLAEEIINLLAQNQAFEVAARTSSFAYRQSGEDIRTIGQQLGVYWVLEGSVRSSGGLLRITTQLIDASSGFHVWSETYDREIGNTLATQDEIAALIASTVTGILQGMQAEQARRYALADYAAFADFRSASLLQLQRTPGSINAAIELYQSVIAAHPYYAPAHAGLSEAYMLESIYSDRSISEAVSRAQQSLELALGLDGKLGQAWASLGLMHARSGLESSAESAYRKAIRLNASYLPAYVCFADLLYQQGLLNEQRDILETARQLASEDAFIDLLSAVNSLARGMPEAGFQALRKTLEQATDSVTLLSTASLWSIQYGRIEQATEWIRLGKLLEPDNPQIQMAEAMLMLNTGQSEQAIDIMLGAYTQAPNNAVMASEYAALLYYAGKTPEIYQYFVDNYQLLNPIDTSEPIETTRLRVYTASLAWQSSDLSSASELLDITRPQLSKLHGIPAAVNLLSQVDWLYKQINIAESNDELGNIGNALLTQIKRNEWNTPALAYAEATMQAVDGRLDAAISSLQTAQNSGWRQSWLAQRDPRLGSLQEDKRFSAILKQLK